MNFFDLHGPMFLLAYMLFFVLAWIAAKVAFDMALTVQSLEAIPVLDPYEAAFLSGGTTRAYLTAVAALDERKILIVDTAGKNVTVTANADGAVLEPFEQALVRRFRTNGSLKDALNWSQRELDQDSREASRYEASGDG